MTMGGQDKSQPYELHQGGKMRTEELGGALNNHGQGDHGTATVAGRGILDERLDGLESDGDDLLRREVEGHEVDCVGGHLGHTLLFFLILLVIIRLLSHQGKKTVHNGLNELVTLDRLLLAVRFEGVLRSGIGSWVGGDNILLNDPEDEIEALQPGALLQVLLGCNFQEKGRQLGNGLAQHGDVAFNQVIKDLKDLHGIILVLVVETIVNHRKHEGNQVPEDILARRKQDMTHGSSISRNILGNSQSHPPWSRMKQCHPDTLKMERRGEKTTATND